MKTKKFFSLALLSLLLTSCGEAAGNTTPVSNSESVTTTEEVTTPEGPASVITTPEVEDEDIVGNTHLKLDAQLFARVMKNKTENGNYIRNLDADGTPDYMDFNLDGVEKMLTESDYPKGEESSVFTNYVDGDTTQFTSYNGLYSVKVRYLAVDTPESTSEIEEWGKAASLFNQSRLKSAKHVIVQSAECARTGKLAVADIDTYQRSLAYVWYTDVENPTQNDFRNLNLELVYEGFSLFAGERAEMVEFDENGNVVDESFYNAFVKANDIARAFKKHMFSGEIDDHYYYGKPKALGLDELYDRTFYTNSYKAGKTTIKYSAYCDEYTKWTFEGVVSRKVGNAFYIQDTIDGKAYGLYVFTLRTYAPVRVGNRIKVSGVLSMYGGAYELSGVSYSMFNHQDGDIEYVTDEEGNPIRETVEPIDVTSAELASGKYEGVLVRLHDDNREDNHVYFNTSLSNFNGEITSYSYGGSEEVNTYNATHPFYNTSNSLVLYGRYGQDMNNVSSFNTLMNNDYVRLSVADDIVLSDENNRAICSYRYFTGTKNINGKEAYHYYVPQNAKLAYDLTNGTVSYDSLTAEEKENVYQSSYGRKKVNDVIGIAQPYVSTGGNSKYSINICSKADFANYEEV